MNPKNVLEKRENQLLDSTEHKKLRVYIIMQIFKH